MLNIGKLGTSNITFNSTVLLEVMISSCSILTCLGLVVYSALVVVDDYLTAVGEKNL
jgi:hypothetical protein